MSTSNYIKATTVGINPDTKRTVTNSVPFFFDDRDPAQVRAAFEAATVEALKTSGKLAFFRQPKIVGPWAGVQEVGHGIGTEPEAVNW